MKVLIAGELNVDLVLQNYSSFPTLGREVLVEDISLTLGSASAICASALAKLGAGVSFIGKVGQDAWGDLCLNSLAAAGVDCSLVARLSTLKTGITVSITSSKDRALVTYLGSSAELHASDIQIEDLKRFDHLHVSSFFLQRGLRPGLKALLERAHEHGLTTSLDPGFDPENAWGQDLIGILDEVDVFLPNEVELQALSQKRTPAEGLHALKNGRTLIVAKLGAQGCMALQEEQSFAVPAFPVKAVDTTGAGDTFNAGFLRAWLAGEGLCEAMRFAAACGALSTLASGGSAGQPSAAQALEFMASHTTVQKQSGAMA